MEERRGVLHDAVVGVGVEPEARLGEVAEGDVDAVERVEELGPVHVVLERPPELLLGRAPIGAPHEECEALVAPPQESRDHVAADEAGAAGQEDAHHGSF